MNTFKPVLLAIAVACLSLLGVALYLQHGLDMKPCPLCVMQRYAFAAIALICLLCATLPRPAVRAGAGLGLLAALAGAGDRRCASAARELVLEPTVARQ